jgi:hypothetical protein
MGVLIYPTSKSIDGPWLLDKNDLEELDVIIDKIYSKFIQLSQAPFNPLATGF